MLYIDEDADEKVRPSHQGGQLMQYSRYIRRGAQRIGATSDDPKLLPSAFENKDGGQVVVVYAQKKGLITVKGMKPGHYKATYGNWSGGGMPLDLRHNASTGAYTVTVPRRGVVSIFPAAMKMR